jgi:predicted nucleotidyltransferase
MFNLLLKSKIRQRIILLFFYHQDTGFYLSGIAKQVEASVGTTQRELNRLIGSDLIRIDKQLGRKIYLLNKSSPFFSELESIIRKTIGAEVELKNILKKVKGIRFAFLFGSYVKGRLKSNSDIDLFVLGDAKIDEIHAAAQAVEDKIQREINYHLTGEKEFIEKLKKNYFYKDIIRQVLLLIGDPDEFRKIIKRADRAR